MRKHHMPLKVSAFLTESGHFLHNRKELAKGEALSYFEGKVDFALFLSSGIRIDKIAKAVSIFFSIAVNSVKPYHGLDGIP